jgi:hypothetical protein
MLQQWNFLADIDANIEVDSVIHMRRPIRKLIFNEN